MRYTVILTIFIFLLGSCNKDKYSTTPQLKFKSVNTKELRPNETISFTLGFTDAEGDLTDTLFVQQFEPTCVGSRITRPYKLPTFPTNKNQQGDLVVTYTHGVNGPAPPVFTPKCNRNDTVTFKFVLRDKALNKSDTLSSPPIVIFR